ncbi:IS1 family transposase, partial [Flammeovirga aprica]
YMRHYKEIRCPHCEGNDIVKNGHRPNGSQRWRCNTCNKSFQVEYKTNGWRPGIKEQIDLLTLNSSGVRDISRTLKISRNMISNHLKKKK